MFVIPTDRFYGEPTPVPKLGSIIPFVLSCFFLLGLLLSALSEGEQRAAAEASGRSFEHLGERMQ